MRTASLEFELRALTEEGVRLPREEESSGVDGETTSGTTSRASPTRVFITTKVRIRGEKKREKEETHGISGLLGNILARVEPSGDIGVSKAEFSCSVKDGASDGIAVGHVFEVECEKASEGARSEGGKEGRKKRTR